MYDLEKLSLGFHRENRKLKYLEWTLTFILSCLTGYAIFKIYNRSWGDLLSVAIPFSTSLSAILIASTATRLIKHNQIEKVREDHTKVVAELRQCLILGKQLEGRLNYIRKCFIDSKKPLLGIKRASDQMEILYERLLSKESTALLPSEVTKKLLELSGNVFGLSTAVAGIVAFNSDKLETTVFLGDLETSKDVVHQIDKMKARLENANAEAQKHISYLFETSAKYKSD